MFARRLKLQLPPATPNVQNYVADWCVHEFSVDRIRYLLFVNTPSLFPMIIPARGIKHLDHLREDFAEGLKLTLEGTPGMAQFDRWIAPELSATQLGRIPGRSLLGSMNDFIHLAYFYLHEDKVPLVETSRALARVPMSYLGRNSPDRVFPTLKGAASTSP
jgi:hypothetical protein